MMKDYSDPEKWTDLFYMKWNWLDFLGLSGLLHILEALWWAQLEPATVVHVPDRLQQDAHFGNPSTDRKGHCTGMVEGVIPQAHLRKETVHLFYINCKAYIQLIPVSQ